MRILVANRGEIARRIMRTAHRLGHETVAVYADPDRNAPFVGEATTAFRLGPAELSASYLSTERLLEAIDATGATAVHPGYGFLAENGGFARAVEAAGCTWIGPNPAAIDAMGSKIQARRLAASAGLPVIPGYDASQDQAALAAAARDIGYPVLVKAAAGGGGKGIRIVHAPDHFDAALREAAAEAERSFGDAAMIVERYIQRPRHVEVQVVGDRHGSVIHLGTRECSVQRRYQKLLEEAPAPNLPETARHGLQRAAVELARAIDYDSVGTVEFVVDDATSDYFFLEMNTRLQVEHPVTEAITGLDLVELQLRIAEHEPLGLAQQDIAFVGHAFEARINAENPESGFTPQAGTVTHLRVPSGVRWDSAVEPGSTVSSFYDPMMAKLIVAGPDREAARRRLGAALDELILGGLSTNAGFQRWLLEQPPIVQGRVTTRFVDETDLPGPPEPAVAIAALAWRAARDAARGRSVWEALGAFRVTPHRADQPTALQTSDQIVHLAACDPSVSTQWNGSFVEITDSGLSRRVPASVVLEARSVAVNVDGYTHTFDVPSRTQRWAPAMSRGHGHARAVVAPFPASVAELHVVDGQRVAGADPVVVLEAMKMLHTLSAAGPGVVEQVRVLPGDQVQTAQVLVTFVSDGDHPEQEV